MMEIEIYHGSGEIVEFPEIRIGRYTKDFSWGFYCTNNIEQARKWARRNRKAPTVNVYKFIEHEELNILKFDKMTNEWLDFIAKCRKGFVHSYDIVEGPMADDTVWDYVQDYLSGDITREAFWHLAKFKYPTHQISFHTLKALSCLKYERSEVLNEQRGEK